MIKRFVFGNPIETEAVLEKPQAVYVCAGRIGAEKVDVKGETGIDTEFETALPYLSWDGETLSLRMNEEDIVYGLGENVRGINKRGWVYVSNCLDAGHHHEDAHSLYGAHNFLLIDGKETFGLFIDTPAKVTFDVGYTRYDELRITVEDVAFELYVIESPKLEQNTCEADASKPERNLNKVDVSKPERNPNEADELEPEQNLNESDASKSERNPNEADESEPEKIVREFRHLIGRSYIPPKWAFGYGQSRWSYFTSQEVREVARQYRENHLPLDMIYLDIDYMDRYKDFTIDREAFPDFEELVGEMKEQGIRLVPIIDAGVKIEEGYDVYEEGIANGYFCKDADGKEFVVGVWPGRCHFPDMLNDEARRWFGHKYKVLLDAGIEGFWNDMNEPAIFYSEKRLKEIFDRLEEYRAKELDIDTFFRFQSLTQTLSNNEEDYRSFYHNYRGQKIRHDKVHNLFGYYMTRSAEEAFEELEPERRILLFSRASYIGMHRYGGIWTGDNKSWWSHLLMNLKMMPSLNMCGFLYTGADIGGFGENCTRDLLLRWLALGIFLPLFRNHSAMGTRRQEPYAFEDTEKFRGILALRYRLLPYIYSEYMKAALTDGMYARPFGFVWRKDPVARRVEDQMMIGESIMIAPVYEQNALGRTVYLPEEMKLVRFRDAQIVEETALPAGHHYVEIPLDEIVLFIRKGHILPLAQGGECVADVDWDELELVHFADRGARYELYDDDGVSRKTDLDEGIQWICL